MNIESLNNCSGNIKKKKNFYQIKRDSRNPKLPEARGFEMQLVGRYTNIYLRQWTRI